MSYIDENGNYIPDDIPTVVPQTYEEDSAPIKQNGGQNPVAITPMAQRQQAKMRTISTAPFSAQETVPVSRGKKILSFIKSFFVDVLNGVVIALSMFTIAGLMIESYIEPPYQNFIWLSFIPFGIVLYYFRSAITSALFGWGTGIITYLGILYWINLTVFEGTGNQKLSLLAVLSLSCVLALQFALFAWACHFLKRARVFFPLTAAATWVGLEFMHQLISYKFIGFTWFILGYTQYENLPLIQISSVTGVYGVSFLIAFVGLCGAYLVTKNKKGAKIFYVLLAMALTAGVAFYGTTQINQWQAYEKTNPAQLSVAIMQPNTHKMMLDGRFEDVQYTMAEQALSLEDAKVDLVIWPESSLPGTFQKGFFNSFAKETSQKGKYRQIFGSYSEENGKEYVSAALFDETGIKDSYNKVKLVPFGEFLPFYSSFKNLYEKNKISSFTGNFQEGGNPSKVFDLVMKEGTPQQEAIIYKIGPTICFESLFPDLWVEKAKKGATFFVNISNDGWFGPSAAPYQHLRALVFRAVETRKPILRSANTGISAIIDATGKIRMKTGVGAQTAVISNFTFQPKAPLSIYTLFGPVFALICLAAAVLFTTICALFLTEEDSYN